MRGSVQCYFITACAILQEEFAGNLRMTGFGTGIAMRAADLARRKSAISLHDEHFPVKRQRTSAAPRAREVF